MKDNPRLRDSGVGGADGCGISPSASRSGARAWARAWAGPGLDLGWTWAGPAAQPVAHIQQQLRSKQKLFLKKQRRRVCICVAVSPPVEPGAGWGRSRAHLQVVQARLITGSTSLDSR